MTPRAQSYQTKTQENAENKAGVSLVKRYFTRKDAHPFDTVEWETTDVKIAKPSGEVVFEQQNVEKPKFWSDRAIQIVAQKYFRVPARLGRKESSVKELISRVADSITEWGWHDGYFNDEEEKETFHAELTHILLYQKAAFNSPVWFNVGVEEKPQCSACQPYRALVSTPSGFYQIGEIVEKNLVGLSVYDSNGVTQVVAVKNNGIKKVYKIILRNGTHIEATGDHLVRAVYERRTDPQWIRVDELQAGMRLHLYPHREIIQTESFSSVALNNIAFAANSGNVLTTVIPSINIQPDIAVSEAALAGWLQGDGFAGQYNSGTNRSLTAEFLVMTEDEKRWVQSHLDVVFPNVHRKVRVTKTKLGTPVTRIRLYGEDLRPFVEKYGLLQRRERIRVPHCIWISSPEVIAAYLKSVFQCEGFVSVRGRSVHVELDTISKDWMSDLQTLLYGIGIYTRIRSKREKRSNRSDLYGVDCSVGSERKKFAERIGFIDAIKQNKLLATLDFDGQKNISDLREEEIIHIEEGKEEVVYDIQTLSGEYLTNNIAVHNCFILSVEDTMPSILEWCTTEGMIFKGGSGAGINLSTLRSSKESLSKGGIASGPVSFMKGADAIAGMVKSGGGTRRAAKMVVLNIDHPDIKDFIMCKVEAEKMLRNLVAQGFDSSLEGKIFSPYTCIPYQNANNSVRVTDEFMRAVEADGFWQLRAVKTGEALEEVRARELLNMIADAAWQCADPGTQYDTTINAWHTCPKSGRINASNPCSEYMSLDNSACNLASLNLLRFLKADRTFDIEAYKHAAHVMFLAQEIIVGNSSYPTPKITENAKSYRQLGLGFANLGALLMVLGLPYDSDRGRAWGAVLTALMTGEAYYLSGLIASRMGSYDGFAKNREDHIRVIKQHRAALKAETHPARYQIEGVVPADVYKAALHAWNRAVQTAEQYGHRNSQATVIAPTGTISFMMDCETTGIEPELFLVKTKDLVGGGTIKIENRLVGKSLQTLGYAEEEIRQIIAHLRETGTIEGAPGIRDRDLPVFDCAVKAANGIRYLSPSAHITMMAAVQPFISGSISKTVNTPQDATKDDFFNLYFEGWRLGLKSLALYREGSKAMRIYQSGGEKKKDLSTDLSVVGFAEAEVSKGAEGPVQTGESEPQAEEEQTAKKIHVLEDRHDEMEMEHRAFVKPFKVATTKGRLIVGVDSTGHAKEIYLEASKVGSAVAGYLKAIGISISKGLRAGVPLKVYVDALSGVSFEPSGFTDDPEEPVASSIISYCMRWMAKRFPLNGESAEYDWGNVGIFEKVEKQESSTPTPEMLAKEPQPLLNATVANMKGEEKESIKATLASSWNREYTFFCSDCGNFMKPTGTNCFTCTTCGTNTGCG